MQGGRLGEKDEAGNTPLHLAVGKQFSKFCSSLSETESLIVKCQHSDWLTFPLSPGRRHNVDTTLLTSPVVAGTDKIYQGRKYIVTLECLSL